ncbi:MAG TPA: hypothetical protein VED59_04310 [Acidimicrobiales bacterium]|nr:hypothetical protein [Acidimicrobiales bacterium]
MVVSTTTAGSSPGGSFLVVPAAPAVVTRAPFGVAIVALDAAGTVDTAYTGAQCLTFSGPDDAPDEAAPAYPAQGSCPAGSSVTFTSGVAAVSVELVEPETTALEVSDNASAMSGGSESITVVEPSSLPTTTTGAVGTTTETATTIPGTTTIPATATTTSDLPTSTSGRHAPGRGRDVTSSTTNETTP